jgi:hypothetical protein
LSGGIVAGHWFGILDLVGILLSFHRFRLACRMDLHWHFCGGAGRYLWHIFA